MTLLVEQDHVEALAAVIERGLGRTKASPREILFEDGRIDRTALACALIAGAFGGSLATCILWAVLG